MYKIAGLTFMFFMVMAGVVMAGPTEKENAAVEAAGAWLTIVDRADYEISWKDASAYFKNAVSQEQWTMSLKGVRAPLGKLLSRERKEAKYMTAVPGAPDGEYVVVLFVSSFENKASAIETVTFKFDADGQWRLAGYFIK